MGKLLPHKELGKVLRQLRRDRGWTQAEFARRAGRDQAELSKWENGKIQPEYDSAVILARTLGVDVSIFEQGEENDAEPQAGYGWGFDWQRVLDILDRESRAAEDRAAAARGVVAAVREAFSPSAADVTAARIAQEAQAIADRAERSRPNALRPPSTEDRSTSEKERDASDPDNN